MLWTDQNPPRRRVARATDPDVEGVGYDPRARWDAAQMYAVDHGAEVDDAIEFADHTGGDGGERSIARAWEAWKRRS